MLTIITTGGTIDKVYFDALSEYHFQQTAIRAILEEANVRQDFDIIALMAKDSLEISDTDRALILEQVQSTKAQAVLITHGTDTMVETAQSLMGKSDKTVVLTGALTPVSHKHSDATFNVGFAAACAMTLPAGVYIAMHGQIFDPLHTKKDRSQKAFVQLKK